MTSEQSARPRDATTVILLRSTEAGPFELFMVKRHKKSAFMANAYVYPGGRLDDADSLDALGAFATGRTAAECAALLQEDVPEHIARGLFLAGIRESFEEAGVLLAHRMSDPHRVPVDPVRDGLDQIQAWRDKLNDRTVTLLDVAQNEALGFPLDQLLPFAHWITPEVEPKRYDTRFLIALCPDGQDLSHDDRETVDSVWLQPNEALDRYADGELQLAPPTFRTLERLSELGTIRNVLDYCRDVVIPPIQPQFKQIDGELVLLLPGDPEFDGDGPAVDGSTRIAMHNGRWWSR